MQAGISTVNWHGPTITFVIPWYGLDVKGGAELQCRRTAEELCARGVRAEVWSTTAGGLMTDWTAPVFAAGPDAVNGVPVQRFPVRPRNGAAFDQVHERLLRGHRLTLLEEAIFVREIIGSDALEAAIGAERHDRIFIFIPYMFGTTYWGARAAGRSYMIPCIHDEAYAYMQLYRQLIEGAHGLLFNSPAEERLARRLYRLDGHRMQVINEGVDLHYTCDADRFRRAYSIDDPFMLYAGRRDPTKNTPLLFEYFERYRQQGGALRLVCIGSGMSIPDELVRSSTAIDLGFVPVQDKFDAYAAASVLCQPSRNESFSLVMMEAWSCGTPALVHSDCAVTREFCEQSGGGLHFRTYEEFVACIDWLAEDSERAQRMGRSGAAYVRQNFDWDVIVRRLLAFLHQHERSRCM